MEMYNRAVFRFVTRDKMSAMDRHLPMDRDYTNEGGVVTLSTAEPEYHDLFVAYLAANPRSPLRIDIPDRSAYRGE